MAEYLGVAANTLRNWGAAGKITASRNRMNKYRPFKVSDLEKLLKMIEEFSNCATRREPR